MLSKFVCSNFNLRCDIEHWDHDSPVSKDALLKGVVGKDGLYCLLTDRINKEVLDAAGK